jgi:uroporphyrinogen decarboxylase
VRAWLGAEDMDHFERVVTAVNKKEPDRVPIDLGGVISGITKIAYDNLLTYLRVTGVESKIWDIMQGLVDIDERVLDRFGVDIRHIRPNPPREDEVKRGEGWLVNEFGLSLRKQYQGYYYEFVEDKAPLHNAKTINEVESYKGPQPHEGRFKGLSKKAQQIREKGFAVTIDTFLGGVLELAVWLRGFNKFYYDIIGNPEFAETLLDKTLEINKRFWQPYINEIGEYATIILLADDYGHQNGLLMSPALWRKIIKPRLKEFIADVHMRAKSAKIQFHSCGSVEPLIEDLVEVGIDILNPIQPKAKDMNSGHLIEKYDKKICYHGGIDVQYVLPKGTTKDVEEEVRKRIRDLAPDGGYIVAAAHNIQPDVPSRNIEAMFKEAQKSGRYPIRL